MPIQADLLASRFPVFAHDESAIAAMVAVPMIFGTRSIRIAGRADWKAASTERIKTDTGQRHSYHAAGESFEGLPPRYRLRHAFRQLIEFVVHNLPFFWFGLWSEGYDA